jgi:hypothetical protein
MILILCPGRRKIGSASCHAGTVVVGTSIVCRALLPQQNKGLLRPQKRQVKTQKPVLSGGPCRVSSETSFDSKQPKLEPKLVSALFETRRLFRLFRFNIETASFGVSIGPKQTKYEPKQTEKRKLSNTKMKEKYK